MDHWGLWEHLLRHNSVTRGVHAKPLSLKRLASPRAKWKQPLLAHPLLTFLKHKGGQHPICLDTVTSAGLTPGSHWTFTCPSRFLNWCVEGSPPFSLWSGQSKDVRPRTVGYYDYSRRGRGDSKREHRAKLRDGNSSSPWLQSSPPALL